MIRSMSAANDLRELAEFSHSRVTADNHFYPGVGDQFVSKCRFGLEGAELVAYAGHEFLLIEIPVGAPIVLAFGRPDEYLVGANVTLPGIGPTRTFSSVDDLAEAAVALMAPETRDAVASLALAANEQVLVAQNKTMFVMRPCGLAENLRRLTVLIGLLELVGARRENGGGEDPERPALTPLAGVSVDALWFLARWAISDDEERERALGDAEDDDLVALSDFLHDHGDALESRIEELGTTDAPSAVLWAALGETAAEAKIELARRRQPI
jgi:hypothetical protein